MTPYSLGKLIDWKQGSKLCSSWHLASPYSLGKLIDWKRQFHLWNRSSLQTTPYSLGKLIDWKPWEDIKYRPQPINHYSLLARETNWLETGCQIWNICFNNFRFSLLARETNWLETWQTSSTLQKRCLLSPYSLGKLIDWKPTFKPPTPCFKIFLAPYSLGKLIDWKLLLLEILGLLLTELPTR